MLELRSGSTLASRMEAADHRPSGFDYLRMVLSFSVLFVHAFPNGGGKALATAVFWETPVLNALVLSILPMFFALSGFLVAGSLYRCKTLISFLGLRFFRIYPALAVEVLVTGIILGPIVTSLTVSEYFTSDGFLRYLWNITGHTTVYLPGSFADNPQPNIANGQLWTVPWELMCYIAISLAAIIGGKRRSSLLLLSLFLIIGIAILQHGVNSNWTFAPYQGAVAGRLLVVSFMAGVCLYAYRHYIPASNIHLLIATFISILLLVFTFLGQYVAVLFVSYVTCALGVRNPRRIGVLRHADLSYGIFLYHFIVQQSIMYFFVDLRTWYWCLLTSVPVSVALAWVSWVYVEKPVLSRKGLVFKVEDGVEKFRERAV